MNQGASQGASMGWAILGLTLITALGLALVVKKMKAEEGKLPKGEVTELKSLLPMSPEEGPPLPRALNLKWPWKK